MHKALVLLLMVAAPFNTLHAAGTIKCAPRWGKPGVALVASSETATEVFAAVERGFFPKANKTEYPDIGTLDGGDYWDVFRWRDPKRDPQPDGSIVIRGGGGQLSMRIDKCNAAISRVFLTR